MVILQSVSMGLMVIVEIQSARTLISCNHVNIEGVAVDVLYVAGGGGQSGLDEESVLGGMRGRGEQLFPREVVRGGQHGVAVYRLVVVHQLLHSREAEGGVVDHVRHLEGHVRTLFIVQSCSFVQYIPSCSGPITSWLAGGDSGAAGSGSSGTSCRASNLGSWTLIRVSREISSGARVPVVTNLNKNFCRQ